MKRRAVVLLSGGLDSAVLLAVAQNQGFEVFALSFNYGQRHRWELACAKKISKEAGVKQKTIRFDLRTFGGSSLTSPVSVPENRTSQEMSTGIPSTYVPARNTIFLSFALAWAEILRANDIFIGVNIQDRTGYPDCRHEFIESFQDMANQSTKATTDERRFIQIRTPFILFTKAQIIKRGEELGVQFGHTSSCYQPSNSGIPCGVCDSCILRREAFAINNFSDPLEVSLCHTP